jgi:ABC-type Fe3+-hydroxamate transport system substrate-binding protein
MTLEGVLALDPGWLIVNRNLSVTEEQVLEAWGDAPLWPEVPAIAEGRVAFVESTITGTYSIVAYDLALDRLMPLLYHETFPTPLTDDQVRAALGQ